jgi:predicted phosphodiesterase
MRYLVLSDVHANLPALEAVTTHAKKQGYDHVMFLGDAVGYYPHAEEVVQRLIALEPTVRILGNHDSALLELVNGDTGDHWAAGVVMNVLERQLVTLSGDSLRFLNALVPRHSQRGFEAAHGALAQQWDYLSTVTVAQTNVGLMTERVLFVGHTHVPKVFATVTKGPQELWRTVTFKEASGSTYRVPPLARVIANPGAVGQPRDQIPLASYMLFDVASNSLQHHRVAYDIKSVQADVIAAGYPEVLATRLETGR